MIDPMNFDELARRKLAEREFTFPHGDWAEMVTLLGAQRKKRRVFAWPFAAALIVAIPATWWLLQDGPTLHADGSTSNAHVEAQKEQQAKNERSVSAQAKTGQVAPVKTIADHKVVREQAAEVAATTKTSDKISNASRHVAPAPQHIAQSVQEADVLRTPATSAKPSPTTSSIHASPDTLIANWNTSSDGRSWDTSLSTVDGANAIVIDPSNGATDTIPAGNEPAITETTTDPDPTTETHTSGPATTPLPTDPVSCGTPEGISTGALVQDSTISLDPPSPLELISSKKFHFEVSALGGSFLSTSTYSGELTETWRTTSTGKWSPSFGAELMTLNKHLGIGIGLHRSRYEEELRAEKLSRTDEVIDINYSLVPIQITVPVITDTIIIGGVPYYVTTPTTITVNQLVTTRDTTHVERILREARSIVNRVDYWELPLLLDAHTSAGKWTFGLRGGPSIGFLSIRTGVIPDMEGTGYVDIDQNTYRATTLGYQARVYVRYGLSDRISLGIEPTVRGQFGNAFETSGISRRNTAFGGSVSVNFRIP